MIATIQPAPSTLAPRSPSVPSSPPLSPRDEALLATFLDADLSLTALIRREKLSFQQMMDWHAQPHIKAAISALTEIARSRACLIASDDSLRACTALQSCGVLAHADFYEQADPATRHRAFESARKAANSVLRLAGLPPPRATGDSSASARRNRSQLGKGSRQRASFSFPGPPAAAGAKDRSRPDNHQRTAIPLDPPHPRRPSSPPAPSTCSTVASPTPSSPGGQCPLTFSQPTT